MYTIVTKPDMSLLANKVSSTVIGDSITKTFRFIIPKIMDNTLLSSYVIVTTIIDKTNTSIDFAQLIYDSDYNNEYSVFTISGTDNVVNYSSYYIWLTFYNINTKEKFSTQKAIIILDPNSGLETALENNKLTILTQIESTFASKISEMKSIYNNTKRIAQQISNITTDIGGK